MLVMTNGGACQVVPRTELHAEEVRGMRVIRATTSTCEGVVPHHIVEIGLGFEPTLPCT